jgi:hypothetical protein
MKQKLDLPHAECMLDWPTHKQSTYAKTHRPANKHTSMMMCLNISKSYAAYVKPWTSPRACMHHARMRNPHAQAECRMMPSNV